MATKIVESLHNATSALASAEHALLADSNLAQLVQNAIDSAFPHLHAVLHALLTEWSSLSTSSTATIGSIEYRAKTVATATCLQRITGYALLIASLAHTPLAVQVLRHQELQASSRSAHAACDHVRKFVKTIPPRPQAQAQAQATDMMEQLQALAKKAEVNALTTQRHVLAFLATTQQQQRDTRGATGAASGAASGGARAGVDPIVQIITEKCTAIARPELQDKMRVLPDWFLPERELLYMRMLSNSTETDTSSTSTMYLAMHVPTNQRCFVKRVALRDPTERCVAALRLWFGLLHPNIVRLVGANHWSSPHTIMATEFCTRGAMDAFLTGQTQTQEQPVPAVALALSLLVQASRGVLAMHSAGVVHTNLRAANILVTFDLQAKLTGLTQCLAWKTLQFQAMVMHGVPAAPSPPLSCSGSVRWLAPECLTRQALPSPATDVYAFGLTIYEALTGNLPFAELTDDDAVYAKKKQNELQLTEDDVAQLDPAIQSLILDACQSNPALRPTMQVVLVRLLEITRAAGIRVRPQPTVKPRTAGATRVDATTTSAALRANLLKQQQQQQQQQQAPDDEDTQLQETRRAAARARMQEQKRVETVRRKILWGLAMVVAAIIAAIVVSSVFGDDSSSSSTSSTTTTLYTTTTSPSTPTPTPSPTPTTTSPSPTTTWPTWPSWPSPTYTPSPTPTTTTAPPPTTPAPPPTTVAGVSTVVFSVTATTSQLTTIAVAPSGYIYVSDAYQILRFYPEYLPTPTLYAGASSTSGFADAYRTSARFADIQGLAIDQSSGDLYVADSRNTRVRRINIGTGDVSTVAGTGSLSASTGLSIPALSAQIGFPYGVALDSAGDVYIADWWNDRAFKLWTTTARVTAYTAYVYYPRNIVVAPSGAVYIANTFSIVLLLSNGATAATVAGSASVSTGFRDDYGTSARFNGINGIALSVSGQDLYIADKDNHCIRRYRIATGQVTTLAGLCTVSGSTNGDALDARFTYPSAIAVDASSGEIYVTDLGISYPRVRKIVL